MIVKFLRFSLLSVSVLLLGSWLIRRRKRAFKGCIFPGEPDPDKDKTQTLENLLGTYSDQLILVDEKKEPLTVIQELADLEEIDPGILHPYHLESTLVTIQGTSKYLETNPKINVYIVKENWKSRIYYEEILTNQDSMHKAYFETPTVYLICEATAGLIETNSNLLWQDYKRLRGVTQEDIDQQTDELHCYLSNIDAWTTA